MDQKFLDQLEKLKYAGIDVNETQLERAYKWMKHYQHGNENPDYPLWLLTRELGGSFLDFDKKEKFNHSKDISTIVLEEYFLNYTKSLGFIFNELKRISKDNINIQVIAENAYDEEESPDVTIEFQSNGETYTITHVDEYGDGGLEFRFVEEELISKIKGSVTKGHMFYMNDGASFTFIYTEDLQKFLSLSFEKGYEKL
jgi:hypothetical protein